MQEPLILSASEIEFYTSEGYLKIENIIPRETALQLGSELRRLVGLHDSNVKYENGRSGALKILHHPLQWRIRQDRKIYSTFSQLLDSKTLWVSIDRAKFVEPVADEGRNPDFLHWDIDPTNLPVPHPIQGLVALSDNLEDEGCFQCVPGYHKQVSDQSFSAGKSSASLTAQLDRSQSVQIPLNAGDLLVWTSLLPHGAAKNLSAKERAVQYVRMYNALDFGEAVLKRRLAMWKDRHSAELSDLSAVELSCLGELLIGLRTW